MKNSIEKNLNSMGFSLPKKIKVAGSYVPFLKEDNPILFLSTMIILYPSLDNIPACLLYTSDAADE